jgi:hypothetical protein
MTRLPAHARCDAQMALARKQNLGVLSADENVALLKTNTHVFIA